MRLTLNGLGLAVVLPLLLSAQAQAADEDNQLFGAFGYNRTTTVKSGCDVEVRLDRAEFIRSVPSLKAMQILNTDYVTQTVVNLQPNNLSMAFTLSMLPLTIRTLFQDHDDIRSCKFKTYVVMTDDFGNDQKQLAISFSFTRVLFQKVNWDHVEPANIPKIAPDFRFDPVFQQALSRERLD